MTLCNESHIKNDIKLGAFAPCYIIIGNDGYLKKQNCGSIVNALVDTDDIFNFQKFSWDCSLQEVYDAKEQLPLMSDKKCVVVQDYDFKDCKADDFEKLLKICGEKSDDCVVVLYFDAVEIDVKKPHERFKKLADATEKIGGRVVLINHRQTGELVRMIIGACEKRGCSVTGDVARFIVEYVSDDIETIKNEIEKLCAYKKNGNIDKETVKKVSIKNIEQSIYELAGKIFAKDVSGALTILDELLYMRIKPIALLTSISSVYVDMMRVYAAKKAQLPPSNVVKDFDYGNRDFLVTRAAKRVSGFTEKQIKLSLEELLRADSKLKGFSGEDRVVLEETIVRLSYIASKGESIDKA